MTDDLPALDRGLMPGGLVLPETTEPGHPPRILIEPRSN